MSPKPIIDEATKETIKEAVTEAVTEAIEHIAPVATPVAPEVANAVVDAVAPVADKIESEAESVVGSAVSHIETATEAVVAHITAKLGTQVFVTDHPEAGKIVKVAVDFADSSQSKAVEESVLALAEHFVANKIKATISHSFDIFKGIAHIFIK